MQVKKFIAGALLVSVALPFISFAQTTTPTSTPALPASLSTLLDQIKALQAQIVALQQQQSTTVSTLLQTLKQGTSGDAVKQLQTLLASDPTLYPEGLITGFFGPKTAAAVKRFQEKNGLDQVGDVGPKTLAKLNELFQGKPCPAAVPPGHLIAPGQLKKTDGQVPAIPPCQILPPGIAKKLGTSTPPVSGTTTPPADTIAPVIMGVSTNSTASTSINILWATNEPATSKVYFATTSPINFALASNVSDTSLVTSHTQVLTELTPSTVYFYVVESKDSSGNTATTTPITFQTANN